RRAVLDELDRLLAPDATVLQLWGSATRDPRDVMDAEAHSEYPWRLRHLFLGYHRGPFATRWLTDEAISHAPVHSWDTDDDSALAGELDPWEEQESMRHRIHPLPRKVQPITSRPTAVKPGTPDVHPSATWDSAPVHMSAYL